MRGGTGRRSRSGRTSHFPHERSNVIETRVLFSISRTWRVTTFRLMLLQMPIKISLLTEASITQGTPKRPFLVMYIPDVTLQIRRYRERPLTILAFIRLLSRVSSKVTSQVSAPREYLSTELARVPVSEFPRPGTQFTKLCVCARLSIRAVSTEKWG